MGGAARVSAFTQERLFTLLRRGLLTLAMAGCLAVLGLVGRHVNWLGNEAGGIPWHLEADLSLTGFSLEQIGPDGLKMRMTADRADLVEASQQFVAQHIDTGFFQGGAETLHVAARHGKLDIASNRIHVVGDETEPVHADLADGTRIMTRSLNWDPERQSVTSEDGILVEGPAYHAHGDRLVADIPAQTIRLLGNVEVVWTP